jgi:hypothetical protein
MLRDRLPGLTDEEDRLSLSGVGLLATAVLLGVTTGLPGVVVGAGLALAWLLLPVVYVVALGQFALVGLYAADTPALVLALAEVGFASTLLASLFPASPARAAVPFVVAALLLTGVVLFAPSVPLGSGALLVVAAAGAYGLHRYERVSMGLVDR